MMFYNKLPEFPDFAINAKTLTWKEYTPHGIVEHTCAKDTFLEIKADAEKGFAEKKAVQKRYYQLGRWYPFNPDAPETLKRAVSVLSITLIRCVMRNGMPKDGTLEWIIKDIFRAGIASPLDFPIWPNGKRIHKPGYTSTIGWKGDFLMDERE